VEHAAIANVLPLMGHWGNFYEVEGAPDRTEQDGNPVVLQRSVTSGYFEAMGVEIVEGRAFDEFDGRDDSTQVAIVNQTFVRTHMSDGIDPIGRRIRSGGEPPLWLTVVAVAHDVKHYGLDEPMRPGIYQPLRQLPLQNFLVVLRTAPDAPSPLGAARALTADLDPELAVYGDQTLKRVIDDSLWTRRATSWLIGAFSTVALLLAIAGLYGVISYSVGQRVREISLRMAIGAESGQVRAQVVRQGMAVVGIGVFVGVVAALALSGTISGLLTQVEPTEPWIYVAVCALLGSVALAANWIPARRAAATDPMAALRGD
jgi:predicted permease